MTKQLCKILWRPATASRAVSSPALGGSISSISGGSMQVPGSRSCYQPHSYLYVHQILNIFTKTQVNIFQIFASRFRLRFFVKPQDIFIGEQSRVITLKTSRQIHGDLVQENINQFSVRAALWVMLLVMLYLARTNNHNDTKTNFFSANIRAKVIIITVGGGNYNNTLTSRRDPWPCHCWTLHCCPPWRFLKLHRPSQVQVPQYAPQCWLPSKLGSNMIRDTVARGYKMVDIEI